MTKPILYYALFSPPSRACIITAKLIGLDIDREFVDFNLKEHLREDFIRLNPQHQIPVLIDNDEVFCDSHAIMAYMVSKYAESDNLYPKDLSKRAKVDQRLYFEDGVLFPVIKDLVARLIYGGETQYNPKTIEACHTAYGFLEKFLENRNYVTGTEMTIADVSIHTTMITLHRMIPVEADKYPNIVAWMERMTALPENEEINEAGADHLAHRIKSFLVEKSQD